MEGQSHHHETTQKVRFLSLVLMLVWSVNKLLIMKCCVRTELGTNERVPLEMTTAQNCGFTVEDIFQSWFSSTASLWRVARNMFQSSQGRPCVSNLGLGFHRTEGIFHWRLLEKTWILRVCPHSPNCIFPNNAAIEAISMFMVLSVCQVVHWVPWTLTPGCGCTRHRCT